ncbi:MAG: sensor domain-containing diguanylate cyclase [Phycisphaerales bacterium]
MNPEVLERVLSCQRLPSLPAVAMRVVELTADQNVNLKELAATITNDQALASKVLKTVNSSFYGLRKPCSTINQAIVMLGLSAVKTLALGFSLVSSLAEFRGADFDLQAYWKRCLLSGIGGKCFAQEGQTGNDEECFLGGLLQDVGQVAMCMALGREYGDAIAPAGGVHPQVARYELMAFEFTHADIGAMLAQRWKLPNELVMPVKYHERPTAAPVEYMKIVKAVALGNIAADVLTSVEPGVALKRLYEKADQWLALKEGQVDDVMKRVAQGSKEVARLLGVDTGEIPSAEVIMARAVDQLKTMTAPFDAVQDGVTEHTDGMIDAATGLRSRRAFNQNVVAGFEQAIATGTPVSVAILAIDDVPELSSTGKPAIDTLMKGLAALAKPLADTERAVLCRFDTLAFGLFMHGIDRQAATRLVEAIRAASGAAPPAIAFGSGKLASITLSAGLATLDETTKAKFPDPDSIVTVAEKALQAAQKSGRNVLRIYAPRSAAA